MRDSGARLGDRLLSRARDSGDRLGRVAQGMSLVSFGPWPRRARIPRAGGRGRSA